ncbi:hypothetical protein ACWEHA_26940 [Amycolatopsis nivea]
MSGISKGYLSKVENEQKPVDRRSTLVKIAGALGSPPTAATTRR